MKKVSTNKYSLVNRVLYQLTADKKKTAIALSLILVMVVMWIKVLVKASPKEARAVSRQVQSISDSQQQTRISYVDLPEVQGRNDILTRDFFAVRNWRNFSSSRGSGFGGGDINILSDEGVVSKQLAKQLQLGVIEMGDRPQAFINDKLVGVGDILNVINGDDTYECEVVAIEQNEVVMKFGDVKIELKLSQVQDGFR